MWRPVARRVYKHLTSGWLVLGVLVAFAVGAFVFTNAPAEAQGLFQTLTAPVENTVLKVIGAIAIAYGWLMMRLMLVLVQALVFAAQYNNFIGAPAVIIGWTIIRDITNMFFVLILLVIAVGTILQQPQYHYRKLLLPLIISAILVNFSRTILGFIIDFSQVIMGTFVAAFQDTAGGNFAAMIGLHSMTKLIAGGDIQNFRGTAMALVLAAVFITIAVIVIASMVAILFFRIIGLWFLIVLSPFAFVLQAVPTGDKYAKKWWDSFTNFVILGPVMAFFLWLSLAIVSDINSSQTDLSKVQTAGLLGSDIAENKDLSDLTVSNTEIGTLQGVVGYGIGITMLIATMLASIEIGSQAGGMAQAVTGGIGKWAAGKGAFSPQRLVRRYAKERVGGALKKMDDATQKGFDIAAGTVLSAPGKTIAAGRRSLNTRVGRTGWGRKLVSAEDKARTALSNTTGGLFEGEGREKQRSAIAKHESNAIDYRDQAGGKRKEASLAREAGDREKAIDLEMEAKTLENTAQMEETKAMGRKLWIGAPTTVGALGAVGLSGVTGGASMAYFARYAPNAVRGAQNTLEAGVVDAQNAQSKAVGEAQKIQKGKTAGEMREIFEDATGGYSRIDMLGALKQYISEGKADATEIEKLRGLAVKLGADQETLRSLEVDVLERYPAQALNITEKAFGKMINKKKGEHSVDAASVGTIQVQGAANESEPKAFKAFLKNKKLKDAFAGDATNTNGRKILEDMKASGSAIETATVKGKSVKKYSDEFKKMLRMYSIAGGAIHDRLDIDVTTGNFTGPNAKDNESAFLELLRDKDIAPHLLANLDNQLLSNDKGTVARTVGAGIAKEVLQALKSAIDKDNADQVINANAVADLVLDKANLGKRALKDQKVMKELAEKVKKI